MYYRRAGAALLEFPKCSLDEFANQILTVALSVCCQVHMNRSNPVLSGGSTAQPYFDLLVGVQNGDVGAMGDLLCWRS